MARPLGELSVELLRALDALKQEGMKPTMREIAFRAQMGLPAARVTVVNLLRAGHLVVTSHRRVNYRNRPVAEYGRPTTKPAPADAGAVSLANALSAWRVGIGETD